MLYNDLGFSKGLVLSPTNTVATTGINACGQPTLVGWMKQENYVVQQPNSMNLAVVFITKKSEE
jgi:hypothetical protein